MISISGVFSMLAGVFGLYLVYMHIAIIKKDIKTEFYIALPIIIGTLACLSTGYEFLVRDVNEEGIILQRIAMIVSWTWLSINSIKNNTKKETDNEPR